jgi:hypothetical protein
LHFELWRKNYNIISHPITCLNILRNFEINYSYLFDLFEVTSLENLRVVLNDATQIIRENPNDEYAIVIKMFRANEDKSLFFSEVGKMVLENNKR